MVDPNLRGLLRGTLEEMIHFGVQNAYRRSCFPGFYYGFHPQRHRIYFCPANIWGPLIFPPPLTVSSRDLFCHPPIPIPPVNIPIQPLTWVPKWVVNSPKTPPKMGSHNGFDHHSHPVKNWIGGLAVKGVLLIFPRPRSCDSIPPARLPHLPDSLVLTSEAQIGVLRPKRRFVGPLEARKKGQRN